MAPKMKRLDRDPNHLQLMGREISARLIQGKEYRSGDVIALVPDHTALLVKGIYVKHLNKHAGILGPLVPLFPDRVPTRNELRHGIAQVYIDTCGRFPVQLLKTAGAPELNC